MTVFLVVGTNGAGKSTFIANCLEKNILPKVEYVAQGFHNANYFSKMDEENLNLKRLKEFHKYKINKLIGEKSPFIFEHALSKKDVFEIIKNAKKNNYRIVSFYLNTDSPLVNIKNIKKRVIEGGHSCNIIKVFFRYYLSNKNYKHLKELSDELYVFDNGMLYFIK